MTTKDDSNEHKNVVGSLSHKRDLNNFGSEDLRHVKVLDSARLLGVSHDHFVVATPNASQQRRTHGSLKAASNM